MEETRDHLGLMLTQVCIDQQDKDTSVEELRKEDATRDARLLLAQRLFADPLDERDDDCLQCQVDANNNEGDRSTRDLRPEDVAEVVLADGTLPRDLAGLVRLRVQLRHAAACIPLMHAEALQDTCEVRVQSGILVGLIDLELVHGIVSKAVEAADVLFLEDSAVDVRVLVLEL